MKSISVKSVLVWSLLIAVISCLDPDFLFFENAFAEQSDQVVNKQSTAPSGLLFGLKPGKGRESVIAFCMPCHSTAIIASNHMNRKEWEKTLNQMQKKNGMIPVPPEIRNTILDYLEANQRIEDRGLTQGKKTPWATPLYRPNPIW